MGQEVKNPLRAQSKYGLMGSSAKPGKFSFQGSPEDFLHKNAIWDRHPPPTHQMQSTCVQEGSRVPNLQMEFNYIDSLKSYGIFSDFVVPVVPTSSPWSPHHPHSPQKVPMWSPWLWSPWSPPHIVPVVPTSPPWSPCHPHHPNIIPMSSRRSPHHPQPPRYPLHPPPHPLGGWSPESVKMQ